MKLEFPSLPETGQTLGVSLILQNFPDKYEQAKAEAQQFVDALQCVVKEYNDLGAGSLTTDDLKHVIALDSEGGVRSYVKDTLIKNEGTIKLGGLTLSPEMIAGMIAVNEVKDLVRANAKARQVQWASRENWKVEDMEINSDGEVTIKKTAVKRIVLESLFLGNTNKSKRIFELVSQLASIQNELNEISPSYYKINLDSLLIGDGFGAIVPNGGEIRKRAGEN